LCFLQLNCKKEDVYNAKPNVEDKFFTIPSGTNASVMRVINEIKRRNNVKEFVTKFAAQNGFPVWNKVLMATSQKQYANASLYGNSLDGVTDTTILIPFVMEGEFSVKGFIKATLNDSVSLSYSLAKDYKTYEEKLDNSKTASSAFAMLSMVLNKTVFNEDYYKITDQKLFSKDTTHVLTQSINIDEINFSITDSAGMRYLILCSTFTQNFSFCGSRSYCRANGGFDAGNCISNPPVCYFYTETNTNCTTVEYPDILGSTGGGSTGEGGGSNGDGPIPYVYPCETTQNNPAPFTATNNIEDPGDCPVPGPGDGWIPLEDDNDINLNLFYQGLTIIQQNWWNDNANYLNKDDFIGFLYSYNFNEQSIYLVKELINWLIQDNSISNDEVKYYLSLPEEGDGLYDATYWENPNTVFQQIALPTLQQFTEKFPKITTANGISYMKSDSVYKMVGDPLKSEYGKPNYQNACAIRGSWAFNQIKVGTSYPFRIPPGTANTGYGANNLIYILNAKGFNAYMHKRFGNPTYSISSAQINGNRTTLNNFLKNLRSQNIHGIYNLATNGGSYSGHVDLMTYGECLGGYALPENISTIDKIEIWVLN